MRILLNKNRGNKSTNLDNYTGVGLDNRMKRIIGHTGTHDVDLYQVYLDEKDASDKYRLIFTVNPVCTNVLFNPITEIVYHEGGDDCVCLSDEGGEAEDTLKSAFPEIVSGEKLTRLQAIRDTEYSHPDIMGIDYLPGADMLNNHIIRQTGFNCVMKRTSPDCAVSGTVYEVNDEYEFIEKKSLTDVFNTIRDYQRTDAGKKVVRKFPGHDATYLSPVTGQPHLYTEADLMDFDTALRTMIAESNGWFGFKNASSLDIPTITRDEGDIYLNKALNNRNSCDFVDFFPDRKRFTFVPQKNVHRGNRLEKNWKYFLTYPYSVTESLLDDKGQPIVDDEGNEVLNPIVAARDKSGNVVNGLAFEVVQQYLTDSGKRRILFRSTSSLHNLEQGSVISLYWTEDADGTYSPEGNFTSEDDITVPSLGDLNAELVQYYFSIDEDDAPESWFDEDGKIFENIRGRFRKSVFGIECQYYFRVFRRVPNFKEISDSEDKSYYISKYNKPEYEFLSEVNKLAFASNIYGDQVAQIVYLDDIDLKGLTDNLERPLSDIYLTIVKANNGHEKWYPDDPDTEPVYADEDMTLSRAFGKVTSGIDLPPYAGFEKDYNVHRLHNIGYEEVFERYGEMYNDPLENIGVENYVLEDGNFRLPHTLEDDITDEREFFLGDLVEFCLPRYEETILEPVYHRFNTAQREWIRKGFGNILVDEIYMDDYEGSESGVTGNDGETIEGNFKCVETMYNKGYDNGEDDTRIPVSYPGNLFPEGYYYQPHYRIHLKDIAEKITQSSDTRVFTKGGDTGVTVTDDGRIVCFTASSDYDLAPNDIIVVQDTAKNIFYDVVITAIDDITSVTASTIDGIIIDMEDNPRLLVFKRTAGMPKYAIHYPDTSGKYVWRSVLPPSKTPTDSEIYDKPFSNGSHYRHVGINFFLKRQDPNGDYKLNMRTDIAVTEKNKLINIIRPGKNNWAVYNEYIPETGIIDMC